MKVRFQPFGVTTEAPAGTTLLAAAISAGVEIESVCGGRGTCAKCKVIATEGLSELTALERKGLTEAELAQGYRLACQAIIESDVVAVIPDESRVSRVSILSQGVQRSIPLEPWAKRYQLQVPDPSLGDQVADSERLKRAFRSVSQRRFKPTLRALQQLPNALRADAGNITLVEVDGQIVRVLPGDQPIRILGIAFDIGTTTVAGYLMDLETGEELAVSSMLNPQTRYGDDVVSRIDFSSQGDGLRLLQREIVDAINHIITDTTSTASVAPDDLYALVLVGNTTMQHLLLGISPTALAQSPYVPATAEAQCVTAEKLGILAYPEACAWVFPNIAGWVGGDTVGVLLSTSLHQYDTIALIIDIGTNGEMALGSRQRLITCSTAAGPAFEGAHLSCGMRAAAGAVDAVRIDGDVHWHAIDDAAPRGICGSGLVDLVAEMLRTGVISSTGMMKDSESLRDNGHARLADRVTGTGRQRAFELVTRDEGAGSRPVALSQRDVRELQLAKGAIRAGIEILMRELGVTPADVTHIFLAGAFGNYIRPESALAIGLIPQFPNAELVPIGNAAGSGARMALLSLPARNEATRIVSHVEYLELSGCPDFQEQFAEAMIF